MVGQSIQIIRRVGPENEATRQRCANTAAGSDHDELWGSAMALSHMPASAYERKRENGRFVATIPERQCRNCGAAFRPKRSDRTSFCGRPCALEWSKALAALRRPVRHRMFKGVCEVCGRRFTGRQLAVVCGEACRRQRARERSRQHAEVRHNPKPRQCGECGEVFTPVYGMKRREFCSEGCGRRHHRRVARCARRARERSTEFQSVSPTRVFERDGYRCALCGVKTLKSKRGRVHPKAPELDHILPLSRGGTHTYANVQCACRMCNQAKGPQPKGQLMLFPEPRGICP